MSLQSVIRVYLIYVLADMVQGFGGSPATSLVIAYKWGMRWMPYM